MEVDNVKIVGEEGLKVEFVQHVGSDAMVVKAARVSTGKEDVDMSKDGKLIKYLASNLHTSPFEHIVVTFRVECPLYIRSQWQRHRTMSYNEWSGRYSEVGEEFYLPKKFKHQNEMNKQGSGEELDDRECKEMFNMCKISMIEAKKLYKYLIEKDVAKEQARAVLPQNMITKFYATANLLNWMRFLGLRLDVHAQYEIQVLSKQVFKELLSMFPVSVYALGQSMFNEDTRKRLFK